MKEKLERVERLVPAAAAKTAEKEGKRK